MWCVYVIYSKKINLKYVGSTDNVNKRIKEHNSGRSKFTKQTNDWELLGYKSFGTEDEARRFERLVKKNKKYRMLLYIDIQKT